MSLITVYEKKELNGETTVFSKVVDLSTFSDEELMKLSHTYGEDVHLEFVKRKMIEDQMKARINFGHGYNNFYTVTSPNTYINPTYGSIIPLYSSSNLDPRPKALRDYEAMKTSADEFERMGYEEVEMLLNGMKEKV